MNIPDLNVVAASLGVLLDVHVDGEMGVDVTHLVEETAGNTDDQVVDQGADGTEGSDTLADTVVQLDGDHVGLGATEGDSDVGEVLDELATGTLNGHNARTNVNLHYRRKLVSAKGPIFPLMCAIQYVNRSVRVEAPNQDPENFLQCRCCCRASALDGRSSSSISPTHWT